MDNYQVFLLIAFIVFCVLIYTAYVNHLKRVERRMFKEEESPVIVGYGVLTPEEAYLKREVKQQSSEDVNSENVKKKRPRKQSKSNNQN